MLLLMGLQMIVAGLVGEMLTRIYHEGRGAPQYHANDYGAGTGTDDDAPPQQHPNTAP